MPGRKQTQRKSNPKSKMMIQSSDDWKTQEANQKALWATFKNLQTRADKAWKKLQTDVTNRAKNDILLNDQKELLLLLGECNYMARECINYASKLNKQK